MAQILSDASLGVLAAVMAAAALAIGWAGTRLAGIADELADRTHMGEIIAGALFVGGATSLPGIIASVSTAAQNYPGLAIGNAVGGLTVQTAFLAIADLIYRRANLEHGAASVVGLTQGTLLVTLLTIPLLAATGPDVTLFGVHPATPIMFVAYGFGLRLLSRVRAEPMWSPVMTSLTQAEEVEAGREDGSGAGSEPDDPIRKRWRDTPTGRLWALFVGYAAVVAVAGYVVGEASIALIGATGLSQTAVGTVFTAIANSLPELVTAIAAVRVGALNLALGDIVGGNSFEVLFLAASDIAYRDGSIYSRMEADNLFTAVMAVLMTGVLLLGLLRRERHGIAGIGFESALVLVLYAGSVAVAMT